LFGYLYWLIKDFQVKLLCNNPMGLQKLILMDSAKIQEEEAKKQIKKSIL
jgi:hypothetical protein